MAEELNSAPVVIQLKKERISDEEHFHRTFQAAPVFRISLGQIIFALTAMISQVNQGICTFKRSVNLFVESKVSSSPSLSLISGCSDFLRSFSIW